MMLYLRFNHSDTMNILVTFFEHFNTHNSNLSMLNPSENPSRDSTDSHDSTDSSDRYSNDRYSSDRYSSDSSEDNSFGIDSDLEVIPLLTHFSLVTLLVELPYQSTLDAIFVMCERKPSVLYSIYTELHRRDYANSRVQESPEPQIPVNLLLKKILAFLLQYHYAFMESKLNPQVAPLFADVFRQYGLLLDAEDLESSNEPLESVGTFANLLLKSPTKATVNVVLHYCKDNVNILMGVLKCLKPRLAFFDMVGPLRIAYRVKNCSKTCPLQEGGRLLTCGHSFHETCLRYWLTVHRTCPVCERRVECSFVCPPYRKHYAQKGWLTVEEMIDYIILKEDRICLRDYFFSNYSPESIEFTPDFVSILLRLPYQSTVNSIFTIYERQPASLYDIYTKLRQQSEEYPGVLESVRREKPISVQCMAKKILDFLLQYHYAFMESKLNPTTASVFRGVFRQYGVNLGLEDLSVTDDAILFSTFLLKQPYQSSLQMLQEMFKCNSKLWREVLWRLKLNGFPLDIVPYLPVAEQVKDCPKACLVQETGRELPCGHSFHDTCLRYWFMVHKSCLVCERRVEEPALRELYPPEYAKRELGGLTLREMIEQILIKEGLFVE